MSVEFIGVIQQLRISEIHPPQCLAIDVDYMWAFAQAHEQAGFDRILVPPSSTRPDAMVTIAYAASVTLRSHFMLGQRPGFVAPARAARQIATLDHFAGGRPGVHFISGDSDTEQCRYGDFPGQDERYARTDEYLQVPRRIWTEFEPFDFAGRFDRFEQGFSEVKPKQQPHVPIYFGGAPTPAPSQAGMLVFTSCGASRSTHAHNRSQQPEAGSAPCLSISCTASSAKLPRLSIRAWAKIR